MTTVINCFGGPGVGKSTTATGVFSNLKQQGVSCEYVSEVAKEIVWAGDIDLLKNQEELFARQFRRQWVLMGQVDYIITDSPLFLNCIYYEHWAGGIDTVYRKFTYDYFFQTAKLFPSLNWFIKRAKPYDPNGRVQTEDEAKALDQHILDLFFKYNINYHVTDSKDSIADISHSILHP